MHSAPSDHSRGAVYLCRDTVPNDKHHIACCIASGVLKLRTVDLLSPHLRGDYCQTAIMHNKTSQNQGSDWVTKAQLASHLACDKRTIGNLMRRRILPFVKIRGLLRFDLAECEAAFRRYRSQTDAEKNSRS